MHHDDSPGEVQGSGLYFRNSMQHLDGGEFWNKQKGFTYPDGSNGVWICCFWKLNGSTVPGLLNLFNKLGMLQIDFFHSPFNFRPGSYHSTPPEVHLTLAVGDGSRRCASNRAAGNFDHEHAWPVSLDGKTSWGPPHPSPSYWNQSYF